MLCRRILSKIVFLYFIKLCVVTANQVALSTGAPKTAATTERSNDFTTNLLNLLSECENIERITVDIWFGSLMAEFIIKENVRFFEPTRYEEQLYGELLQRLRRLIQKAQNDQQLNANLTVDQRTILANVFRINVQPIEPKIKTGHIDVHFGYRSLIKDYKNLVNTGFPNSTRSDYCLAMIVANNACDISQECMDIITSDLPTFGYQRTHQILLLYVFMHHKCAQMFGSQMAFEILASQRCTQVHREQNVIRALGVPATYRDLYLEQNVVCGLLGYAEFLNWHFVNALTTSWPHAGGACLCQHIDDSDDGTDDDDDNNDTADDADDKAHSCECTTHINSLAIVYLLLLN